MMIKNKFNIWDTVKITGIFWDKWIYGKVWKVSAIKEIFDSYCYLVDDMQRYILEEELLLISKNSNDFYIDMMKDE